jgi:NADH dehydrogenase/NADH:ubiquinone oxidoreductase subunit G
MAKRVKVKIDGKEYRLPEGMNLIDAAESVGIHIPNFCYIKGMKGIGACRMCMVEVGGRMAVACNTRIKEGLEVITDSEKIRDLRRFVVDLIVSMHPLDCMTCTKAGVCELQRYAYEYEVKESSFTRKKFGFGVDDKNPFIKRDPDYCILCGRCVRVCKEQGTAVLDFYGRGVGSRVVTAEDRPLQEAGCTFCGSCVDACPVNALLEADRWRKGREWEYERRSSVCLSCGSACRTIVSIHGKDVAKVNIGAEDGRADHYICAYGRFGFDFINADTRLRTPLKRIDGELKEISWDEAFQSLADVLKSSDEAGILITGNLLNEDILTLKRFADVAGIKSYDSTVSLYADEASLLGPGADVEDADLIVLVGLSASQWDRVLAGIDATVRKKVARGTKLVVINSTDTKLSEIAHVTLKGDETGSLASVLKALSEAGVKMPKGLSVPDAPLSEEAKKAAELFVASTNPLVLSSTPLFEASSSLALLKGAALAVPIEANAKGTLLMGFKGEGTDYKGMAEGGVKVLYCIGEVSIKRPSGVDFLVVQHSHMTELAKEADLLLPATTLYETEGTIVDYKGRLSELHRAVEPYEDAKTLRDTIKLLAKKMGLDLKVAKTADVKKQIKAFKVELKPSDIKKREDLEYNPEELIPQLNTSMINSSRLLWLKEVESSIKQATEV